MVAARTFKMAKVTVNEKTMVTTAASSCSKNRARPPP